MRKGYALAVTMMMTVIISSLALGLWATTRDDVLIAGNNRRIIMSKITAQSGMNHFMALNIFSSDLRAEAAGRPELTAIQSTTIPGTRQEYEVKVKFCCDGQGNNLPENRFYLISIGSYRAGGRISAQTVLTSLVETREIPEN